MRRLTQSLKAEIRRLSSSGLRTDQIAKQLGLSEAQVVYALGR